MRVRVGPAAYFAIVKLSVEVLDENDNAPTFVERAVRRALKEDSAVGTSLALPTAIDRDGPAFSVRLYRLAPPASTVFGLAMSADPVSGVTDLRLVLRAPLDRERQASYALRLLAVDGGTPPQTGTADVTVDVIDVNDNNPTFAPALYNVSVPENALPTGALLRLHASDPDAGVNGEVWYRLRPDGGAADLFAVSEAGDLTLRRPLDYERAASHVLVVEARDRDEDSIPARATVVVTVEDVNDNAPAVVAHDSAVSEAAPPRAFVAHLTVTDADAGAGGRFACALNSTRFRLERLDSTEFKVTTTTALDRETQPAHDLLVVCVDDGVPAQTSTTHVVIAVADENDNGPVFASPATYRASLLENAPPATWVVRVNATDADDGDNARTVYSIEPRMRMYFSVDAASGDVTTTRASFDRERDELVTLVVTATDALNASMTATATLFVVIVDVDDEPPVFARGRYDFAVAENSAPAAVGTVTAVDADSPPYDVIVYSIDDGDSAGDVFAVNATSGELRTLAPLDRELKASYTLRLLATGPSGAHDACTVSVTVADVNDNAPTLVFPNDTVRVSSRAPPGYVIARVIAADRDSSDTHRLVFALRADEPLPFAIGTTDGLLLVNASLAAIDYRRYVLSVRVTDGGGLWTERALHVVVDSSLEFVPGGAASSDLVPRQNLTIVIVIAVVSAVIVVMLVVAIGVFLCRQRPAKTNHPPPRTAAVAKVNNYDVQRYEHAQPEGAAARPYSAFTNYAMTMRPETRGEYERGVADSTRPAPPMMQVCHHFLSYRNFHKHISSNMLLKRSPEMGYDTVKKSNSEDIPLTTIHKPSQGLSQQNNNRKVDLLFNPGAQPCLVRPHPAGNGQLPGTPAPRARRLVPPPPRAPPPTGGGR